MSTQDTLLQQQIRQGGRLFDGGAWFEASEVWEEHRRDAEGRDQILFQGLVQLAAALHKGLVMRQPPGMMALAHHAAQNLAHVAQSCAALGGLDMAAAACLAYEVEEAAQRWLLAPDAPYPGALPRLEQVMTAGAEP